VIEVAIGIVLIEKSVVLIAKRPKDKSYGGLWEFPGGKLEAGESPSDAATRELREELGIHIDVVGELEPFDHTIDSGKVLRFYPLICRHLNQEVTLTEHTEFLWAKPSDLSKLNFAAPDYPVIRQLEEWLSQ
jgi:8-oxo-dGTP diphosphatase